MILEGTTSSGAVVPVQVTGDGKVVAEGLQGPQGPEGPQGPPGPDSGIWDRTGTVVSPTNAGDTISTGDNAVQLVPGISGSPLVRDSNGRLLVGTATARTNFFNFAFSSLFQVEADASVASLASLTSTANGNIGGMLILGHQRSGSVGGNAVLQSGDQLGLVAFMGSDGSDQVAGAEIKAEADGTPGPDNMPGRLGFYTTPSGSTIPVQRMNVAGTGVVTIGADSAFPAVSLDPGSTGVPLVRDSVGRLLVGMNSAPAGTLAGDVVCQGAVVLQSPNGMWWAIEVQDDGTIYASQTSIR